MKRRTLVHPVTRCGILAFAAAILLTACGGPDASSEEGSTADIAAEDAAVPATEPASAAGPVPNPEEEEPEVDGETTDDQPVRTISAAEVPDPCRLLTAEDVAELLGEPVGPLTIRMPVVTPASTGARAGSARSCST